MKIGARMTEERELQKADDSENLKNSLFVRNDVRIQVTERRRGFPKKAALIRSHTQLTGVHV